ncbi:MAG: hypothetical protein MJD61_14160, partial [Proteobacteria bacterium]|nr:hypothetical protein [Pseudomonadota bacterium]
ASVAVLRPGTTSTRVLETVVRSMVAPLLLLGVLGCESLAEIELIELEAIRPDAVEPGERLQIVGEGFALDRSCRVRFSGYAERGGGEAVAVLFEVQGRVLSPRVVEVQVDPISFAPLRPRAEFVGEVSVHFAAAPDRGVEIAGRLRDVRLALVSSLPPAQSKIERREQAALTPMQLGLSLAALFWALCFGFIGPGAPALRLSEALARAWQHGPHLLARYHVDGRAIPSSSARPARRRLQRGRHHGRLVRFLLWLRQELRQRQRSWIAACVAALGSVVALALVRVAGASASLLWCWAALALAPAIAVARCRTAPRPVGRVLAAQVPALIGLAAALLCAHVLSSSATLGRVVQAQGFAPWQWLGMRSLAGLCALSLYLLGAARSLKTLELLGPLQAGPAAVVAGVQQFMLAALGAAVFLGGWQSPLDATASAHTWAFVTLCYGAKALALAWLARALGEQLCPGTCSIVLAVLVAGGTAVAWSWSLAGAVPQLAVGQVVCGVVLATGLHAVWRVRARRELARAGSRAP